MRVIAVSYAAVLMGVPIVGCDNNQTPPSTLVAYPSKVTQNDLAGPLIPSMEKLKGEWELRQGRIELTLRFKENQPEADSGIVRGQLIYELPADGSGFCALYFSFDELNKRILLHHHAPGLIDKMNASQGKKTVLPPSGTAELLSENLLKMDGNINYCPGRYLTVNALFVRKPASEK